MLHRDALESSKQTIVLRAELEQVKQVLAKPQEETKQEVKATMEEQHKLKLTSGGLNLEQMQSKLQASVNHSASLTFKGRRANEKARGANIMLLYTQLASMTPALGRRSPKNLTRGLFRTKDTKDEVPIVRMAPLTCIDDRVSNRKQPFAEKGWGRAPRRRPRTRLPPMEQIHTAGNSPKRLPMQQVVASSGSVVTLANLNKISKTNRKTCMDTIALLTSCSPEARSGTPLPHRMVMGGLDDLLCSTSRNLEPRLSVVQAQRQSAAAVPRFQPVMSQAVLQ
jgi:hypothetical protein